MRTRDGQQHEVNFHGSLFPMVLKYLRRKSLNAIRTTDSIF